MTKAQTRRTEAMKGLHARFVADNGALVTQDRAEIANGIRSLSPLGRTERWLGRVEQWAQMVEDPENNLDWAYSQGSVYASYAID